MSLALSFEKKRVSTILPFAVIAGLAIILGGVLSAVVALHPTRHPVWASAYLVLVVGVAQFLLAFGQSQLAAKPTNVVLITIEWIVWNFGNAIVIYGTFVYSTALVIVGSILMAISLALFAYGTRHARDRILGYLYRVFLVFVLLSSLVGIAISMSSL